MKTDSLERNEKDGCQGTTRQLERQRCQLVVQTNRLLGWGRMNRFDTGVLLAHYRKMESLW